ncbi:hypothetical protein [Novosphingobium aquimarinum]|uniref:hypothetical protein n=1 Tax=Novosphingobium aquimarinum TaxID=2682494 RepID=UPI0012EB89D4|nr:hypothetical protein [Novosphingobium aquimarinum]
MSGIDGVSHSSRPIVPSRKSRKSSDLSDEILALLGEELTVKLAETLGGRRVYIPICVREKNVLSAAIGCDAAELMSEQFAPAMLRIGIFRTLRAHHYKSQGLSAGQIATRLCMTETGVDKLFRRERNVARGAK